MACIKCKYHKHASTNTVKQQLRALQEQLHEAVARRTLAGNHRCLQEATCSHDEQGNHIHAIVPAWQTAVTAQGASTSSVTAWLCTLQQDNSCYCSNQLSISSRHVTPRTLQSTQTRLYRSLLSAAEGTARPTSHAATSHISSVESFCITARVQYCNTAPVSSRASFEPTMTTTHPQAQQLCSSTLLYHGLQKSTPCAHPRTVFSQTPAP
jgi:hypothetical protein